jgi:hypothetical protein
LPVRHDVDSGYPGDLSHLLDDLGANALAFAALLALWRAFQPGYDFVRDADPGDVGTHLLCCFCRSQRPYAHEDEDALVQTHVPDLGHERAESGEVEAELGLDEVCAGIDFFRQPDWSEVVGWGERVAGSAEEQVWRGIYGPAAEEGSFVPEDAGGAQQGDGVQVEHGLCAWLVFVLRR